MVWHEAVNCNIYKRIAAIILFAQDGSQVEVEATGYRIRLISVARVEQSEKALVIPRVPEDNALVHASVVAVIPLVGHTCGSCRHGLHYSALSAIG